MELCHPSTRRQETEWVSLFIYTSLGARAIEPGMPDRDCQPREQEAHQIQDRPVASLGEIHGCGDQQRRGGEHLGQARGSRVRDLSDVREADAWARAAETTSRRHQSDVCHAVTDCGVTLECHAVTPGCQGGSNCRRVLFG